MGCTSSLDKREVEYEQLVWAGNVLAVSLKHHWLTFMKELRMYDCDDPQYEALFQMRAKKVTVNWSLEDAQRQRLTYEVAEDVARKFIGYAAWTMINSGCSGTMKFNLKGAGEQSSSLTITGVVVHKGNGSAAEETKTEYKVWMAFFLANPQ